MTILSLSAPFFSALDIFLILICSATVIARRGEPAVTLAWILVFFLLPRTGATLFLFFGIRAFRLRRRHMPSPARRADILRPTTLPVFDEDRQKVIRLASALTGFPLMASNRIRIFDDAAETNQQLVDAIRAARHHVHMEYYIFDTDPTGVMFRDLLCEKARQGVQCRLLMDAVGSFNVSESFLRPLREAGGRVAFFNPVRPVSRPWSFHYRNHRKLTVIDGRLGFLGSQNIGRNFLRWRSKRISWRETDVMIEGAAVTELQAVFAEDWEYVAKEALPREEFSQEQHPVGDAGLQVLPTGPDRPENALSLIFLAALHGARHRVTITTPYFAPTPAVILAMEGAALRGVTVDLLVPRGNDHPVVRLAARSWYPDLIRKGVRLREFTDSFLHSKVVTVDDRWALVGSPNMDARSFRINFELSLLIYDEKTVEHLTKRFDQIAGDAPILAEKDVQNKFWLESFGEGVCRVLAPLL